MFEWLEQELSEVRTPRFHLVEGPAEPHFREAVIGSHLPISPSYKEFVLKFGNTKLYRRAKNDSYRIGIFSGPNVEVHKNALEMFQIGFHDGAKVYLQSSSVLPESPVFERELESFEKVADSFEVWLQSSCLRARKSYGKEKWDEILRGPAAFNAQEIAIVNARNRISWRILGVDARGNHIFQVTNASALTLPALTVGVRSKDGRLNGTILLPIDHVPPGHTVEIHADCYKDFVKPEELEIISLPEPRPEDRDRYHEFD